MTSEIFKFKTLLIPAGHQVDPGTASRANPVYQTSSYRLDGAQPGANLFALKEFSNICTRILNPTTDVFEKRMAAVVGGVAPDFCVFPLAWNLFPVLKPILNKLLKK